MSEVAGNDATACSSYGPPIMLPDATRFSTTKLLNERKGTGWPAGLVQGRAIARGSNSKVYRGMFLNPPAKGWDSQPEAFAAAKERVRKEGDLVIRMPRHDSDTSRVSHAKQEFACSAMAAYHGVGADIFDAFYAPRTTRQQRKGLYIIHRHYPMDLHGAIFDHEEAFLARHDDIGAILASHVGKLANMGLLLFDLKSANVVLRMDPLDVRIIDYGREFCERRDTENASEIKGIDAIVASEGRSDAKTRNAVMETLMLVILSAIITHELHAHRRELKIYTREQRENLNPLRTIMKRKRAEVSPLVVRCVKKALRRDVIRDTIVHYCGARDSNTRRFFQMAGFVEEETSDTTVATLLANAPGDSK